MTLSSLTSGAGSVQFDQSGGGDLTTNNVTATTSATITNSAGAIGLDGSVMADSLVVDASGAVTDCVVTNMTVAESFGDAACTDVKKRAIFEPAMDEAGRPMASFYTTRLRYTMRAGPDYTWPGQS